MLQPLLNVLNDPGVLKEKSVDEKKLEENDQELPPPPFFLTAGWRGDLRSGPVAPP